MTLDKLNTLSARDAQTLFKLCCGSSAWVRGMTERRPFRSAEEIVRSADEVWEALSPDDWKEAFAHHPRIGDIKEMRRKFASTAAWAEGEQSGVGGAPEKVIKALYEGNNLYESKFGYIFIVCATGKSAQEMLSLLNERLNNIPKDEIAVAAREQAKITKLRIGKILTTP
jgi:2-oxo-4-hydroxy-4-carboxy-5-ureidoimidazoline decarboxylase